MGPRVVPPPDYLREIPDPVDLILLNPPGNDYLITLSLVCSHHQGRGRRGCHLLVGLIIVPDPHHFLVGDPEIHPGDCALASPLQLSQPLVRYKEVPRHRHGKNTVRAIALLSKTRNAISEDGFYFLL